ncbi:MAG: hypothetical protein ACK45B_12340 [Limisphaerales bacterium]
MNTQVRFHRQHLRPLAVALLIGLSFTAAAQQGQLTTRPLTPQEIKDYGLPAATQTSGGLFNVGLGQPAYLEAQVRSTIPSNNILGVTWELVSKPVGSTAELLPSPLPAAMPIYSPGDAGFYRVAGRSLLKPDVTGPYLVRATVNTNGGNLVLTRTIYGATYMGAQICALCHSGGALPDMMTPWRLTGHATTFTNAIDGHYTSHFNQSCIKCHTVGYDTTPGAVNGGFDDAALAAGWTFPTNLTVGNYMAMPAAVRAKANVQCENCHGPGSEHAFNLGDTNRIAVSFSAGDCAQCHDSEPYHLKGQEWLNSQHAIATRTPTGETRASCVRCHSAMGFTDFVDGVPESQRRTAYEAITCAACHDPHGLANNVALLRSVAPVTLLDGITTVTNGGKGQLCMQCHIARRNAVTYVETTAGSSGFSPHYGPQTDMLMGANAITYGKQIPSSAHREVVRDTCVACHLQPVSASSPAFGNVGGHTFKVGWDGGTPNDPADDVHLTGACVQCHGNTTTFNLKRQDYDGNGIIEGVQTEVKGLMAKLARLLPPIGQPTVTITASYTKQQLRAAYNYKFVEYDGSYGVHNTAFAVGLLKASIADLTGDSNEDGLPDAWQIQYFGSATAPNAAPNATPAGDGVPNWLKYALGLNPTVPGIVLPDGIVWANAGGIEGGNDAIRIYTAAEVVFNTVVGKKYQLQAISTLGGGWTNVGAPVNGTGAAYSFVTPTRSNTQQFFRVIEVP